MDFVLKQKDLGNESFQKGLIDAAEFHYNEAIRFLQEAYKTTRQDEIVLIHATLLSNIAMCLLKRYISMDSKLKIYSSNENIEMLDQLLQKAIQSTSDAIHLLDQSTLTGTHDLRSKLLYRRSKAQYHLATLITSATDHTTNSSSSESEEKMSLLTKSVEDLHQLLSFDKTNQPAIQLLQHVKSCITDHLAASKSNQNINGTSQVSKALAAVQKNKSVESVTQALKFIHASVIDDLIDTSHELMLNCEKGLTLMVEIAFSSDLLTPSTPMAHDLARYELSTLAAQILSCASAQPSFAKALQSTIQSKHSNMESLYLDYIRFMLQQSQNDFSCDYVTALILLQLRFVLYCHLQQDDYFYNTDHHASDTNSSSLEERTNAMMQVDSMYLFRAFSTKHIIELTSLVFASPYEKCRSMALNLLSAMIDTNPLQIMKGISNNETDSGAAKIKYSSVKEMSEDQVRQLPPKDLSLYRRKCYYRSRLQQERARRYAFEFCSIAQNDICYPSGLNVLLDFASKTDDGYWRHECILTIGRLLKIIRDDFVSTQDEEKIQDGEDSESKSLNIDACTKKIVYDCLAFEENKASENNSVETATKKCIFVTSLLLASGDIGSWAIRSVWNDPNREWLLLATSNNSRAMTVATDLASAAAGVEGTRVWISSLVDSKSDESVWKMLLTCSHHEVRSGAASTMAKLGLADKSLSSDEGELFSLLEVAAGLLYEGQFDDIKDNNKSKALSIRSTYESSLERGVELISYLATKTFIKDEISHGISFHDKSGGEIPVLDRLVQLADPKQNDSPAVKYSIASIFASLSVSVETLKMEAFMGKDITAEQYDQMQAMSKTKEELESDESKQEKDDPDAVMIRNMKMAKQGVPSALVHMMDDASTHTLERIVLAMVRMAVEPSVRGSMIQQGCLSACIKLSKKPVVTSASSQSSSNTTSNRLIQEVEKNVLRHAQHTIAKLLVTTNPNSLTTSQCMGSIRPLMQLIQDSSNDTSSGSGSSNLPIFEALLSLTNLASLNDSVKERIISEKGISILSYCMFSDHTMVRRAATECMSNLVPHPKMLQYLSHPDHLKVWVAFGMDYQPLSDLVDHTDNDGRISKQDELEIQNQNQCASAALGCLAMVTQSREIASVFVKLSQAEKCVKSMMECGDLELMHRVFVLVLNLVHHCHEDKYIKEFVERSGAIAFCEAYFRKFSDMNDIPSNGRGMKITLDLAQEILRVFYQ